MAIENKEVFQTVTDAVNEAIRKKFGPPDAAGNEKLLAQIAVATLQLSLRYFAETRAPKAVIREFIDNLLGDNVDRTPKERLVQDGNRLILPGQAVPWGRKP